MDRKRRPISREKRVSGGSYHVGRRGSPTSGGTGGYGTGRSRGRGFTRAAATSSPILIIIVAVLVFVFGKQGTGGGSSVLPVPTSGQSGGILGELIGGLAGGQSSFGDFGALGNLGGGGSSYTASGVLNTKVAAGARDKRTVIRGGGRDTVTVMVYMCGTDLESNGGFATKDLQEMCKADISDKVNLLVFTGGCKNWQNNVISSKSNQVYQIKGGGLKLVSESGSLRPMTDPDTLSGFIRYSADNFPADRYALIFWDHGGGSVSGYGYDEVYSGSGSMTLDGIDKALKDGRTVFDFIGFDACLMATLETALVAEQYADYLIASEETEPGCGWYYTDWLNALSENSSMPTLDIGKNIIDSFVNTCASQAPRQQATLSLIDLAELSATLPRAFNDFSKSTAAMVKNSDYGDVASARSGAKEFASSSRIDQVDLVHLARNMDTAEGTALADVLESAVKYNLTSSGVRNAYGVSIYFPYDRMSKVSQMADTYDKIGLDSAYSDCIKSFASVEAAGQTVAGGSAGQTQSLFSSLLGGGQSGLSGELIGSLLQGMLDNRSLENIGLSGDEARFIDNGLISDSEEYFAQTRFDPSALEWSRKNGEDVIVLSEEQWDLVQSIELNVFVDDGEGYIDLGLDNVFDFNADGDLLGTYDGTWLALDGHIVSYYMLSAEGEQDNYQILGRVPAYLNGRRVNLMLSFTNECPEGEVLGASICYDGVSETETQARGLLSLEPGDELDFVCGYYDYDRNYIDEFFLGEPLTVSGDIEISNVMMERNSYIAAYRFTDVYNNRYWTEALS